MIFILFTGITIAYGTNKCHICMFCGKGHKKLTRHQTRRHKDEKEVKAAMALVGEEQQLAFEKLRLRGDFHHNWDVLSLGDGQLIVVRNPRAGEDYSNPKDFLPCPDCLGFFKADELWRHVKRCPHKTKDHQRWLKVQNEAKLLLPRSCTSTKDVDKDLFENVISKMKKDPIAAVASQNALILKFGAAILEKVGPKNANYVSQRMRQLARLLAVLRKRGQKNEAVLEEFIDTSCFDKLVDGVRELCDFDLESRSEVGIPSLALKLGHSIKKCAQILKGSALRQKDDVTIKHCNHFIDLFEAEWTTKISARSLASLGSRKMNKVECLPLAEDLLVLKKHLEKKMAALSSLLMEITHSHDRFQELWSNLAKTTLARVIIFNKRRSGETATLQISQFEGRPKWANCSPSLKESLTPLEKRLCER